MPQKLLHKLSVNQKPGSGVVRGRGTVLVRQNNNQHVSQKDMKDSIYYDKLLFQEYKKKLGFGEKEAKLVDTGNILTFKRTIVKTIKIEDTAEERRLTKKKNAEEIN